MMNRNEAIKKMFELSEVSISSDNARYVIDKIFDDRDEQLLLYEEANTDLHAKIIHFKNKFDLAEQNIQIASSDKTCDGCVNKPLPNENYPEVCGTCSRWYSDNYEEKRDESKF